MAVVIPGGAFAEVRKYAGVDLRSLGVYADVNEGVASAPAVRGANLLLPYSTGKRWAQKYFDERSVVLTGTMLSTVSRADFQSKLDSLKSLFPIGAGEQKLEVQRQDGTYRYLMAEVRNTLGLQDLIWPTKSSPFSIEMVASDPIWYGSALEASSARQPWNLGDAGVLLGDGIHFLGITAAAFARILTSSPVSVPATNSGTYFTRKPVFYLTGSMVNPSIVNTRNGYSVAITVTTGPADVLVIDCSAQTVTKNGGQVAPSLITLGAGQVDWMHLEAGSNVLTVTLGVGGPRVNYSALYSPAYL